MTKFIKSLTAIILLCNVLFAQAQIKIAKTNSSSKDETPFPIFSFGDEMVQSDEFLRVFNKNKRDQLAPTQSEIEEYLDLYVKFKLKVKEAYSLQMDTVPAFIQELAGYRKQLAQPYLTDKTVTERLIKEAYDRRQMEVNAAHLLINCAADAKPMDSLAAYQKIMGLRNRIVNGESFGSVASQYSEDPSAKTNKGDLGYFTAFQMIYPFENAAFNSQVGEVSMPIRTQFGYHLVYVKDKRETLGDIKVAHIAIKFYNEGQVDSTKSLIDAVYQKLQDGADWNDLVDEFSQDFNSNSKGGELNWFNRTTAGIPIEFKNLAYTLENDGDYSKPIRTKFSWHIVKRIELKAKPSYDDSKEFLRRKVERDSRSELNKEVVVRRVKKENNFREVAGYDAVKNNFDKSLLEGKYKADKGSGAVLCKISDKDYTDGDFYKYVATNQTRSNKALDNAVADMYANFIKQINLDYEESQLELKYEDFKYIMQEYKDGILLFELTDKEVWSKAVKDTTGLEEFYAENASAYMWEERADATIYSCNNAKVAKALKKKVKKGKDVSALIEKFNTKDALTITTETVVAEKAENEILSEVDWKQGVYDLPAANDRVKFIRINNILPPATKPLKENMGQATSDYQNYLEKNWIEQLKAKYPVEIYSENVQRLYAK